jgi:hypothetical protein
MQVSVSLPAEDVKFLDCAKGNWAAPMPRL